MIAWENGGCGFTFKKNTAEACVYIPVGLLCGREDGVEDDEAEREGEGDLHQDQAAGHL